MKSGLYAEFDDPSTLARAIARVREAAPVRIEAYTPYAVPEIERALATRKSRLSTAVLAAGFGAASGAYGLQWLLNAYLYPLDAGGRPPHFPLGFVPITFEMGVLFASLTAFLSVVIGGRLMRLWHPSSEAIGIESATGMNFWLEVIAVDRKDEDRISDVLRDAGALAVRHVEAP